MLVLSRKQGDSIIIGGNIRVTVARIESNQVRIGIEAPRDVQVLREEIMTTAALPPKPEITPYRHSARKPGNPSNPRRTR